jgi:hypothetical protein
MAEVAVSQQMFAEILSLIARLRAAPAPAWAALGSEATDDDVRGASRRRQSEAFQRLGADDWLVEPLPCTR